MFFSLEASEPIRERKSSTYAVATKDILVVADISDSLCHCLSEITGHSITEVNYNEPITKERYDVTFHICVVSPDTDTSFSNILSLKFPLGVNLIIFFAVFPDFRRFLPFNNLILQLSEELKEICLIVGFPQQDWTEEYQQCTLETVDEICPDLTANAGKGILFLTAPHHFIHTGDEGRMKEIISAANTKVSYGRQLLSPQHIQQSRTRKITV